MQEQEHPKLKVRDIEKMTEDEAQEELEKRGLLYDEMPEGSEITMTIEEMEEENSGLGEMSYKDMLIESVVIDENGVFIGEPPENKEATLPTNELFGIQPGETLLEAAYRRQKLSEEAIVADKPETIRRMGIAFNPKSGKMERVTIDKDVEFEIPQYINLKIGPSAPKKEIYTLEELIKYL
jgi:hypothetical protein